jgi:hypothetical protein
VTKTTSPLPNQNMVWPCMLLLLLFVSPVIADTECQVIADPDVLGLGVRLGLYFQLTSNCLIGVVKPAEAADSLVPTSFFLTGFFAAVIFSVARNEYAPGAIIACTYYPLLVLATAHTWQFKTSVSIVWVAVLHFLYVVSSGLSVWFWYKGVDSSNSSQCMEPRVFFFANCSATGRVRVLFQVLAIVNCVIWFSGALWFTKAFIQARRQKKTQLFTMVKQIRNANEKLRRPDKSRMIIAGSGLLWVQIFVIALELQIKWNRLVGIDSVNTTGQIIPLVIGSLSLGRTILLLKGSWWSTIWSVIPFVFVKILVTRGSAQDYVGSLGNGLSKGAHCGESDPKLDGNPESKSPLGENCRPRTV